LGKALNSLIGLSLPLNGWTGNNKLKDQKDYLVISWLRVRHLDKKRTTTLEVSKLNKTSYCHR